LKDASRTFVACELECVVERRFSQDDWRTDIVAASRAARFPAIRRAPAGSQLSQIVRGQAVLIDLHDHEPVGIRLHRRTGRFANRRRHPLFPLAIEARGQR
jgi:hypothetical protein